MAKSQGKELREFDRRIALERRALADAGLFESETLDLLLAQREVVKANSRQRTGARR